jgi:sugar O-acyltransferase (sialic acid O-acetyltransferase NeuD family)
MKTKKLIIVGTSNNAKLAKFYFDNDSEYKVVGFAVDSEYIEKNEFCGLQIFSLQQIQISHPPSEYDLFVAIGYKRMNKIRQEKYSELKKFGYKFPNYISSKCSFLTQEKIGDNNFILEDNTIQPFVKIGSNNVFWSGNHIGHDVEIGDHNFITSHVVISGFTKVGNNCFFGVNSTFRDAISIADFNLIAAGAIIMKDTKEGDVYLPNRSILSDKKSFDIEIS